MKRRLPATRKSRRYVRFKAYSEPKPDSEKIEKFITGAFKRYAGVSRFSSSNLKFIDGSYDCKTGEGILRVNRGFVDELRASLVVYSLGDGFVGIENCSGTINSLRE